MKRRWRSRCSTCSAIIQQRVQSLLGLCRPAHRNASSGNGRSTRAPFSLAFCNLLRTLGANRQRHDHLGPGLLLIRHGRSDYARTAGIAVLVLEPLEDALGGVPKDNYTTCEAGGPASCDHRAMIASATLRVSVRPVRVGLTDPTV